MQGFFRICRRLAVLWFAVHALSAWALSGADVAYLVNQRYQRTPSKCFVDKPAQACSGVLMRVPPSVAGDFWNLSSDETSAGIAHFDYVRRDIDTARLANTVGFILADWATAVGDFKPYDFLCGCPPSGDGAVPPCSDCPGKPNTVGVNVWNVAEPGELAVQAIFYDPGNGGQLTTALQYQRQYFLKTSQWLPILRVAFGPQGTTSFGYDERDQLDYGDATVRDLSARYADTRAVCADGRTAYYCNGVFIRVTGWSHLFHSWNPSPVSVDANGVPFSYIRADAGVDELYWHTSDAGIIMRELAAPVEHPIQLRCIFAEDNSTGRPDRCFKSYQVFCNALGITTVAAFLANYKPYDNCAFATDPASFQLSIDVRPGLPGAHIHTWNEAIIAIWPQDIPLKIGIEAFFYIDNDYAGAQFVQRDYMAMTGRFMPIIQVNLKATDGQIFNYDPLVQAIWSTGADSLPPTPMAPKERSDQQ